jgi:hypothetical protein
MGDAWAEAEEAYLKGNEALEAGDIARAHALFAKAQAANWFWMGQTMEAARIAFLQFVGELPALQTDQPTGK